MKTTEISIGAPINLNYAQKLRRDGAGFYLSELARGFLKGEVILHIGGKRLAIATPEFVDVAIDLQQAKGAYSIEVRVSWNRMDAIKPDRQAQRKAG